MRLMWLAGTSLYLKLTVPSQQNVDQRKRGIQPIWVVFRYAPHGTSYQNRVAA